MAGSKGSAMGFLVGRDIQMPRVDRLFFDPVVSVGYFKDTESYIDGNPDFPDERAGSNDSDKDNFVKGDGWDNFFRLKFKYLLPMGTGRDQIIASYKIKEGLLKTGATGGTSLNPFKSGLSYLELRPFYRSQQIDGNDVDEDVKTNGLDFSVFWDNRDFYANPSKGFGLRGKVSRDFGWSDSSNSWTNVEGELDMYLPLQLSNRFRQTVLALDYWTSYSPTWDEQPDGTVENRPPAYTGSTLGGIWRLRGYPSQRFNDKAAVYYAAELRIIPRWNPFNGWPWIQKYVGIRWLQFVPFVEVGRVAPEWDFIRLHSNMKWNVGLGMRAWAKGIVIRIDTAVSDEEVGVQMMVSQPFQF
jgi:outer membrane protein assembly factor BamA